MRKLTLFFASLLVLATFAANASPIVEFRPGTQAVTVGNTVAVDVYVTGLQGQLVGAYDLSVGWDAGLLAFSSVIFDFYLDSPLSIQNSTAGAGEVNVSEVSLDVLTNQIGLSEFRLFGLTFTAIAAGTSPLSFLSGGLLSDFFGDAIEFSTTAGSITIKAPEQSVPEPGTLALLGFGLAGLGLSRRRKA
jgi:hypothetical protein